jgi:hypothetical protein
MGLFYAWPVAGRGGVCCQHQDRDGIAMVLDHRTRRLFPFIGRIHGDGGY